MGREQQCSWPFAYLKVSDGVSIGGRRSNHGENESVSETKGYRNIYTIGTQFHIPFLTMAVATVNDTQYTVGSLISFVLPAVLCPLINSFLKKLGWVKDGDMKLNN